jgi:hypothetical protein
MTIQSDLERNRHVEDDAVNFLGDLINEKRIFFGDDYENISSGGNFIHHNRSKTFSFDSNENINHSFKANKESNYKDIDTLIYEIEEDHVGLRRRVASPNLSPPINTKKINIKKPSQLRNLLHSNVIFQQLINLISGQDFKFYLLENTHQIEDYIKSLDNTPVYYTFNCGIIYVPFKGIYFII